jgi:hypothetical protein
MKIVSALGRCAQRFRKFPVGFATLAMAIGATSIMGSRAEAGIVAGQSNGVAISSNLTLTPIIGATVTANLSVASLSDSAPTPYTTSTSTSGSFSAGTVGLGSLVAGSTSAITTSVNSNITGSLTSGSAAGLTTIDNLSLSILGGLVIPELSIGATTLTTDTTAAGTYGALVGGASPAILGLSVDVLGLNITSDLTAGALVEVASLSHLVGLSALAAITGLEIGIDVSSTTGNGTSSVSETSDNIILMFTNVGTLDGNLNGTIEIGQSFASIEATAVPEPASVAMLGLGLLFAGTVGARRIRKGQRPLNAA